ncbi:hypothetical protein SUGI_0180750 [Cryptomeria japonica]|nr:hypothetical protein SUGI_0180750 [Cryptomeria japonica]
MEAIFSLHSTKQQHEHGFDFNACCMETGIGLKIGLVGGESVSIGAVNLEARKEEAWVGWEMLKDYVREREMALCMAREAKK